MYYEEKIIGGVLHYRTTPDGDWLPKTPVVAMEGEVMSEKELTVHYYKTKGRFYFGKDEQQWQVVMRASNGTTISELWDEDTEPETDGLMPSEIAELISQRVESYWINTSREESRKKIAWFRENAKELDIAWAKAEIQRKEKKIESINKEITSLRVTIDELEDE